MKFSIRRKSKFINEKRWRSALFIVSAFALSISVVKAEEPKGSATAGHEGLTARSVFEKMETSALEILPPTTRLDMLDYWDVDSVYKASNAMEGLSWLETVTPDYLKVRITSVSTLEIKILPDKKYGELVMTVHTVGDDAQAEDSDVKFYDKLLNQLQTDKFFVLPRVKDFFEIPKGSATKMKEIEDMIPFPTIAITANPDNDNLEARLTVEKYVNEDDWNIARLFVKPFITLKWEKGRYKVESVKSKD